MILSYKGKRTEQFGRGEFVKAFQGLGSRQNDGSRS